MHSISTLKMWVINNYVVYKKCFYIGQIMGGGNKYSDTTTSIISTHLKYINSLNLQNILALLHTHDFCHVWIILVHSGKLLFNTTERDPMICKWWWLLRSCTIMEELYISWNYGCWLQLDRICFFRTRL